MVRQFLSAFYHHALSEAEQTDVAELNTRYLDLGDHFRDEFVEGLKLLQSADRAADIIGSLKAQFMLHQEGDWFDEHFYDIRVGAEQAA